MRSEQEIREVANYCWRVTTTKVHSMHPPQDLCRIVQRALSWALGDSAEAWDDMHDYLIMDDVQQAIDEVRKERGAE